MLVEIKISGKFKEVSTKKIVAKSGVNTCLYDDILKDKSNIINNYIDIFKVLIDMAISDINSLCAWEERFYKYQIEKHENVEGWEYEEAFPNSNTFNNIYNYIITDIEFLKCAFIEAIEAYAIDKNIYIKSIEALKNLLYDNGGSWFNYMLKIV